MLIPTLSAALLKNKKIPPFSEGYIVIFLKSSAMPLNSALLSDFLYISESISKNRSIYYLPKQNTYQQ